MASFKTMLLYLALVSFLCNLILLPTHAQLLPVIDHQMETYIVHLVKHVEANHLSDEDLESWHKSFLPNAILDSGAPRLVYSYRRAISGFAARLTPEEVKSMERKDGFLYARPKKLYQLQTTYTPRFLGLSQPFGGAWDGTLYGEGIVIGVIDSGIIPTHPSFSASQMPPPPPRWKGGCSTAGFRCNYKIIGAKGFLNGSNPSPIDDWGHGTHVASTAAGAFVNDANVLGNAKGTASGMAPKAHLAVYKVCFENECWDSDILAAMDQAIADGVDVISMSVGRRGVHNEPLYENSVAQGSFAAFREGISTCTAAGNDGPEENTLGQSEPWVTTVGASDTDRKELAVVKVGGPQDLFVPNEIFANTAYQPSFLDSSVSSPVEFPGRHGDMNQMYCLNGSLDHTDVRGKVVLCNSGGIEDVQKGEIAYAAGGAGRYGDMARPYSLNGSQDHSDVRGKFALRNSGGIDQNVQKGEVVYAAGGAAMIIMNLAKEGNTVESEAHVLPAAHVSFLDGLKIRNYVLSNSNPTAAIKFKHTQFGFRPSPAVASFSSRGPSETNGDIIKPDVLAPGVNILAAWPSGVGPHPLPFDTKRFNFQSGTSMAVPHVSGIVALLKYKYNQWSPAAIHSAIVTSAKNLDLDGNPIVDEKSNTTANIYATGAGQVNPAGALDPGLVYDLTHEDYKGYLCGLGYSETEIVWMIGELHQCSSREVFSPSQLNYPSIAVSLSSSSAMQTVKRTATNVGDAYEVYRARIQEPPGVGIYLSTYRLEFTRLQQEKSFNITFTLKNSPGAGLTSGGNIQWISDKHVVTSPIAVRFS